MGCGSSKIDASERDAVAQNAKIERQLRQDRKVEQRTVKILLLGKTVYSLPSIPNTRDAH